MVTNIQGLIGAIGTLVKTLIPIAVGVGFLVFFWGLATFIFSSANEKSHEEGKNRMIWGVVAIFVMVSVWGLVLFLQKAFFGGKPTSVLPVRTPSTIPADAG